MADTGNIFARIVPPIAGGLRTTVAGWDPVVSALVVIGALAVLAAIPATAKLALWLALIVFALLIITGNAPS